MTELIQLLPGTPLDDLMLRAWHNLRKGQRWQAIGPYVGFWYSAKGLECYKAVSYCVTPGPD